MLSLTAGASLTLLPIVHCPLLRKQQPTQGNPMHLTLLLFSKQMLKAIILSPTLFQTALSACKESFGMRPHRILGSVRSGRT